MLNKLEAMLNNETGHIIANMFEDLGEQTLHLANLANMFAIVTFNEYEKTIEVAIEEYDSMSEEYFLVASKEYKTLKGAFRYIIKMLP